MSIFYAFSNNRYETRNTYDKICEQMDDIIIDVDNNDILNSNQLLDKIKNHIDTAIIFIADVTPDYILNNIPLSNPNVMLELGYALDIFGDSNIILLCNEKFSKNIPSLLAGFEITFYNSDDDEYYMNIIEKINNNLDNYMLNYKDENNTGWTSYNYLLSDNFLSTLKPILDIILNTYKIRINKSISQCWILFFSSNGYTRKINIFTKTLYLKNKEICLSNFNIIYDELKHLEILLKLDMLKSN